MTQPILHMLIGLPGSGKSTWLKRQLSIQSINNYVILSTDDIIEELGRPEGLTYSQAFDKHIKEATKLLNEKFRNAVANKMNIYWDQTNLSIKKRRGILLNLPKDYYKIATVFIIDDNILQTRLDNRYKLTGKHIPKTIIENMKQTFQMPTLDEGFNEIFLIQEIDDYVNK